MLRGLSVPIASLTVKRGRPDEFRNQLEVLIGRPPFPHVPLPGKVRRNVEITSYFLEFAQIIVEMAATEDIQSHQMQIPTHGGDGLHSFSCGVGQ